MNGLLLSTPTENKDIKFSGKNIKNLDENEKAQKGDFFEDLIKNLLQELPNEENKNFLIGKLFDLPKDFDKNQEIMSHFSKEKLFLDKKEEVSIESLIQIASFLQNSNHKILDFPTDSKALKTSLLDLNVQKEFKNAKNIQDLLNIAQKHGIKVKNIEFFKEEKTLDLKTNSLVKKINSEEFFKTMDNQIKKLTTTEISKTKHNKDTKSNVLQNLLATQSKQNRNKTSLQTDTSLSKAPKTEEHPTAKVALNNKIIYKEHEVQKDTKLSKINTKEINKPTQDLQKTENDSTTKVILNNKEIDNKNISKDHEVQKNNKLSKINTKEINKPTQDLQKTENKFEKESTIKVSDPIINNQKTENKIKHNKLQNLKTVKPEDVNLSKTSEKIDIPVLQKYKDVSHETNTINKQAISSIYSSHPNKQTEVKNISSQNSKKDKKIQTKSLSQTIESAHKKIQTTHKDLKLSQLLQSSNKKDSEQPIQTQEVKKEFSTQLESSSKELETKDDNSPHPHTGETKTNINHIHKTNQNIDLKKTFHNFAQDFKEKVESYKAPLMKIKMQLTPGNLGDVDVTLINRGNNLHVSINSNTNTIALFVQNQAEFKNSLVNMGFTGLQMNFGDNGKDTPKDQSQKQNSKNSKNFEEENLENDNFEIIVPRYV